MAERGIDEKVIKLPIKYSESKYGRGEPDFVRQTVYGGLRQVPPTHKENKHIEERVRRGRMSGATNTLMYVAFVVPGFILRPLKITGMHEERLGALSWRQHDSN